MKNKHIVLVLIIFALCAGCRGKAPVGGETAKEQNTYDYTCEDGTKFTVEFNEVQDNMILTMDGKTRTLIHLMSGSGTRYGDGEVTYWGKGDAAMLIRGDLTTNCKVVK